MKIVIVREIAKRGAKTKVTIEDVMDNPDMEHLKEYLTTLGFYEPKSVGQSLKKFIFGGK